MSYYRLPENRLRIFTYAPLIKKITLLRTRFVPEKKKLRMPVLICVQLYNNNQYHHQHRHVKSNILRDTAYTKIR